jgi:PBP1b-binding outer membrane lipoprotein LpoB
MFQSMNSYKKLALLTVASAILFMVGCNTKTDSVTTSENETQVTFVEESSDSEKYIASLAIDGMACEMACGSKISGTLADLSGVKSTSIEFNGAEEENFAVVEFDANEISEKEMIAAVEALNNGHYSVKSVKVTHFTKEKKEEKKDKVGSVNQSFDYDLPNFFSVFSRLF